MLRSKRGRESIETVKRGISLIALAGLIGGIASGLSGIGANEYVANHLTNEALATFVERLNSVFFLVVSVGVPAALLLFFMSRLMPRAFRAVASVLALAGLIVIVCHQETLVGPWPDDGATPRGIALGWAYRFVLVLLLIGAGRLIYEIFPALGTIVRLVPFRLVLVTLFLLGAANSADYINRTKNFPRGPNVILITVNALRPDHMSEYGYPRMTTPNLDRLAARGILFDRTFTSSPRTTQALASIFTGRWSRSTGVRALGDALHSQEITFPEVLHNKGYVTGGFASLPAEAGDGGFDQGFDRFETSPGADARSIVRRGGEWVGLQKERPFFLWLHFSDPSVPYGSEESFSPFGDGAYEGPFKTRFDYVPTKGCVIFGLKRFSSADSARAVDLYDGDISRMDAAVGELVQFLEKTDRFHNCLFIMTGTSGESLGDNDYFFDHGEFLYDANLRVPFLVSAANLPDGIVGTQVRTIDIVPTLLDVLHLEKTIGLQGRSLMGVIERPESGADLPVFAESGESLAPLFNERRPISGVEGKSVALRDGAWKLIVTPMPGEGRRTELFDLEADPGERENVAGDHPDIVASMRREIEEWIGRTPAPERLRKR